MPPERGAAVGNAGVIEIASRIGDHPDTLHDGCGTAIALYGEGHDFVEAKRFEAVGEPGFCHFGDIASAPEFGRQPPADLDRTGRQEGQMAGSGYPDKAYAFTGGSDLGRGEAEAVAIDDGAQSWRRPGRGHGGTERTP